MKRKTQIIMNDIETPQTDKQAPAPSIFQKIWANRPLRYALGITLGAAAGFAYWHFVGCESGSCPIKSNAYYMTGFGAVIGFIAAM